MTERIFDFDGHILEFDAKVLRLLETDKGYGVILDRTAFAPEGGGQLSDIGSLGDAKVIDVQAVDGELVHYIDKPVSESSFVHGSVDKDRRIRHLQNHSGEHIVAGLIYKKYGFNNVGFHLGHDDVTVDVDGVIDITALREIEREANEIVVKNLDIYAVYPDKDELKNIFYRSKLDLSENVRIVVIDGMDACACCAPHVKKTGEIGIIKLITCQRYKGGTRIHMKCGFDALDEANGEYDRALAISNMISLPRENIADGVKKLLEDVGALKSEIYVLKKKIVEIKAESAKSNERGNIVFVEEDMTMQDLRALVEGVLCKAEGICAAFSGNDNDGYSFVLGYSGENFKERTGEILNSLSCSGGGKAPFIQGKAKCTAENIRNLLD